MGRVATLLTMRGKGLGGSSGATSLDIRASVGTSTSPTSTGTKAVTGVGFEPKVVLPFEIYSTANGAALSSQLSFGAMTASAQAAISVASNNAATTTLTGRRHTAAAVVNAINAQNNAIIQHAGAYNAFGVDGFTIDWSTSSLAAILNHIALGGADLEVSLTQQQMNGTNAAQSFAHGLSGAPTGVLFFGTWNATSPASTLTILQTSIGAWSASSQWGAYCYSNNGVSTTNTGRILSTNDVLSLFLGAKSILRSVAVSSVDSTNVNVTYPVTTSTSQVYFWMLAIRGAKCQVGTFNCNGLTSPLTIATAGIRPKLFLPVFVPSGVASAGSVLSDLCLTIGSSDGTNNVSCGISDENGVTTTNARRAQSSTSLCEYSKAGVKSFEATATFSGESVVVTPTTAAATFGQAAYLCIGS